MKGTRRAQKGGRFRCCRRKSLCLITIVGFLVVLCFNVHYFVSLNLKSWDHIKEGNFTRAQHILGRLIPGGATLRHPQARTTNVYHQHPLDSRLPSSDSITGSAVFQQPPTSSDPHVPRNANGDESDTPVRVAPRLTQSQKKPSALPLSKDAGKLEEERSVRASQHTSKTVNNTRKNIAIPPPPPPRLPTQAAVVLPKKTTLLPPPPRTASVTPRPKQAPVPPPPPKRVPTPPPPKQGPVPLPPPPEEEKGTMESIQTVRRKKNKDGTLNEEFVACETCEPVIVMMAYKRTLYMEHMFSVFKQAIAEGKMSPDVLVVVSHDGHNQAVMDAVSKVDFMRVKQIFHPHACQDNPNSFPADDPALREGPHKDQYGSSRSSWATCLKHHWWWMMNNVWDGPLVPDLHQANEMLFLEDDMLLYTDFHRIARKLIAARKAECNPSGEECFGVRLQGRSSSMHSPICIPRSTWNQIKDASHEFCHFDDYNWDLSLNHLWAMHKVPVHVIAPAVPQVAHAGKCDGWDNPERNGVKKHTDCAKELRKMAASFEKKKPAPAVLERYVKTIVKFHKHKGWGGWAHPKDQEHCMSQTNGEGFS